MTEDSLCKNCKHRGCVIGRYEPPLTLGDSEVKELGRVWCKKEAWELTGDPASEIITECSEFERAEEAKDPAEFCSRNYRKNEKVDQK